MGKEHGFEIDGSDLLIRMTAPHQQVLEFFPNYEYWNPTPGTILDYRNPLNKAGHTQRAFMNYWSIRAFIESGGIPILDLGSAGVHHLGCLAQDLCGNETHPVYGGGYTGVHVKGDAANLSMFLDNSFSAIISLHLLEHLDCVYLRGDETAEEKIKLACPGREIGEILRYHWLRVIKPGGIIASIIPDNEAAVNGGSHVFYQDRSHAHAWSADEFHHNVISQVLDLADVVEYNTFFNHFSVNVILRKR